MARKCNNILKRRLIMNRIFEFEKSLKKVLKSFMDKGVSIKEIKNENLKIKSIEMRGVLNIILGREDLDFVLYILIL